MCTEREVAHHLRFLLVSREAVNLPRTWSGVLPKWIIAKAPIYSASNPQDDPSSAVSRRVKN
jgi:hypothetical protein